MKGIVLEIKKDRCIVLKENGTFANVKNMNYAVGEKITLRDKKIYLKILAAAACITIVCITSVFSHILTTPTSYIYLDINPSIRLDLNSLDNVVSIVPLNKDAQDLLNKDTVSHNVENCIKDIVEMCYESNYINDQNRDIEINVRTNHNKLRKRVEKVSSSFDSNKVLISVFDIDEEHNKNALDNNISVKELRAAEQYTKFFGGDLAQNIEIVKNSSADDILEQVREYRRSTVGKDNTEGNTEMIKESQTTKKSDHQYYIPQKRLRAITQYTNFFGGKISDNIDLLRDVDTDDIYNEIREYRRSTKGRDTHP